MRLSPAMLHCLPAEIARYSYDRGAQKCGIVHFGIGAFHRAHQAWYTDLAMDEGSRDWAICGVSLRSRHVAEKLNPQDGLYTVTERSDELASSRLIGSVREVLFAPDEANSIIARIASPDCRIISFTVTEKGYARAESGGLDFAQTERSFYPLLAAGLADRRLNNLPGVTILSCDNLAENGRNLRRLICLWLEERAPDLIDWFTAKCTVPSSMIDRIVPRSTSEDLAAIESVLGVSDKGAVFTENFSQWVVEDDFAAGRPDWDKVGVRLVDDVLPFETAKLRMLNGAHSLLAYCGLREGYTYVHEAVADPKLAGLAKRLMTMEAAPSVEAAPGQDLASYAEQLMRRFADPALRHSLAQIAMDGTQKIPQRWLETVEWHFRSGRQTPAIAAALQSWLWHIGDGRFLDDPAKAELETAYATDGEEGVWDLCFENAGASALWKPFAKLRVALSDQMHLIDE